MQPSELSRERAKEVRVEEAQDGYHQSISVNEIIEEFRAEEEQVTVEIQNGHHPISVSDDLQWIEGMTKRLNNECREKTQGGWPCAIFKVPEDIRQCDTKAYDPLVVTIGPYHYNKSEDRTILAMQAHKWQCVRRLLSRHTKSRRKATDLFGKCLMEMQKRDADVRGSYTEDLHHLTSHDLALIMLLDGCFIIHFLLMFSERTPYMVSLGKNNNDNIEDGQEEDIAAGPEDMVELDAMEKKQIDLGGVGAWRRVWEMMLYDLVKVENQIPFNIIQALFNELKTPGDEDKNLVKIARDLLWQMHPSLHSKSSTDDLPLPDIKEVQHLLHLFHSTFIPSTEQTMHHQLPPCATELQLAGIEFVRKKISALFHLFHSTFIRSLDCLKISSTEQQMDFQWLPSATELQLAGVEFVRKKKK